VTRYCVVPCHSTGIEAGRGPPDGNRGRGSVPVPAFRLEIGDGDGGESPIPDKSGTGTGERPRRGPPGKSGTDAPSPSPDKWGAGTGTGTGVSAPCCRPPASAASAKVATRLVARGKRELRIPGPGPAHTEAVVTGPQLEAAKGNDPRVGRPRVCSRRESGRGPYWRDYPASRSIPGFIGIGELSTRHPPRFKPDGTAGH
jgi:hypothetical protein